jgi:fucose 4-O-acetylase-like acetyltransferase
MLLMKDLLFNSGKILGRSRYPWVDYARGICIILVCYRHIFEGLGYVGEGSHSFSTLKYLNIFFFSFRMPLFFIVSGMFFSAALARTGVKEYISKRFNNIFYPLLIWGSLQVTLQLVFAKYVNADRTLMDYLNLIIDPREIEQFWYLNALFFVGVLYAAIRVYARFKPWHQLILGIMFFITATFIYKNQIEAGFIFDVLFFYFFFAVGDLIADFILNAKHYKLLSSPYTMLVILPVFVLVQHYFTTLNLGAKDDYFVQYNLPALYIVAALVGGAFIVNLSFILERWDTLRFLRVVGYHSLYIYVMHLMITAFTRIVFTRIVGTTNIPLIMAVSLVAGVVLPIILYNLFTRWGLWWLFTPKKAKTNSSKAPLELKMGMVSPKESVIENK